MFSAFEIDPPWAEQGGGKIKRGADRHYQLMNVREIEATIKACPLWNPAPDCLLWLWTTESFRERAVDLGAALGFRKCAAWIWAKVDENGGGNLAEPLRGANGLPLFSHPAKKGLGQWGRSQHEHLLLLRKGNMKVPAPQYRKRSVIFAPRVGHSVKPQEAKDVIEITSRASLGNVPMAELFARKTRTDWWTFGHINGGTEPTWHPPTGLGDES